MPVTFTPSSAERIAKTVRAVEGEPSTGLLTESTKVETFVFYEGELTSSLTATTNGQTAPTTCTARRWVPIPGDTNDPVHKQLDTVEYKLVNRSNSPSMHGTSGTYVIWIRLANEWRVIWLDC